MKLCVYSGPTLHRDSVVQSLPGAEAHGPVGLGDVVRAVQRGATAIAIIDGFFDQRQPVWHKEILWALSRGIVVYGAASMGALRAAELHTFGMRGVGRIFELFRDGWLDRDDEVAVTHGPAESGYRPTSTALVDMRFSFRAAQRAGAIDEAFAERCIDIAQATFYAGRDYRTLLQQVRTEARHASSADAFERWLGQSEEHRIGQKERDALELLRLLADERKSHCDGPGPGFSFARTHAWNELARLHGVI